MSPFPSSGRPPSKTRASRAAGRRTRACAPAGISTSSDMPSASSFHELEMSPRTDRYRARAQVISPTGLGAMTTFRNPWESPACRMPARPEYSHSMMCPSIRWLFETSSRAGQDSVRAVAPLAS